MKVLILAGGFGTRLSEETQSIPKPMVSIGDKPILWHIMKIYSHYGFNDFVILLGYKGDIIKEYFMNYFIHQNDISIDLESNSIKVLNNTSEPWKVTLIDTGLNTMTGGRIKRVENLIIDNTFMLTYGDGVADINIHELIKFHKAHGKTITMTVVQPEGRFGSMRIGSSDKVDAFIEKPKGDGTWINGGFFVCEPNILDYIEEGDSTIFERKPLESLATDGELYTYKHYGFWRPMDTLRDNKTLFILRVPPPYGGGEIVSKELYSQLKDRYDFLLICQKGHSKAKQAHFNISSIFRGIEFLYLASKEIIIKKPEAIYIGLPKTFGSFLRNSIIILFSNLLKIKVYGELHGMSFVFLNSYLKRKYFNYILKKISKIRVLGFSVKNYLQDIGFKNKIYVINNGISKPLNIMFKTDINKNTINFLYLGAISENKGFKKVLDIFYKLERDGFTNWKLNIIGEWVDFSQQRNYYHTIVKNDFQEKIVFHGRLLNNKKWEAIRENDFLLHLSNFDGQPLTIIETMSIGIPVIATKVGTIPEMITDNENGFLIDNIDNAINIISKILNNNIDYKILLSNCLKTYSIKFTGKIMAEKVIQMIKDK